MALFNESEFLAIQQVIIPRSKVFSVQQKAESVRLVKVLLQSKDKATQGKFSLLLKLIQIISFIFGFQKFEELNETKKIKVLNFFYHSPIPLLRKGFWGLNTLCKMGAYGQKSIYQEIHYEQY